MLRKDSSFDLSTNFGIPMEKIAEIVKIDFLSKEN
jgi:hypothetical protein